jgi:pSer/pThr/pTyr-binding forkhead associated (FHA) protein
MLETHTEAVDRSEPDGSRFRRHSIFEQATAESLPRIPGEIGQEPDWLSDARHEISERGRYLAFVDDDEQHVVKVEEGWTRIGRSEVADIQLDDATVSRRHVLIVNEEERGLRVLDDRSLNGIYLNGDRIEWGPLDDGDELRIGRYRLFVIDAGRVTAGA